MDCGFVVRGVVGGADDDDDDDDESVSKNKHGAGATSKRKRKKDTDRACLAACTNIHKKDHAKNEDVSRKPRPSPSARCD